MNNVVEFRKIRVPKKSSKEGMKNGLIKRGKYYTFARWRNGKRTWHATKQTTREHARLWVEKHILIPEKNLELGIKPVEDINFKIFSEKYLLPYIKSSFRPKTYLYYTAKFSVIYKHFGKLNLSDITPILLEEYKMKRVTMLTECRNKTRALVKPISINKEIGLISILCDHAIKMGYLRYNPCQKVSKLKEERYVAKFLSEEDFVNKFLPAANPKGFYGTTELYMLLFYIGCRTGEALNLKWKEVDFNRKIISFWTTKTNIPRHVPMNHFIESMLRNLKKESQSEYVFVSQWNKKLGCIRLGFKATLKRAGLSKMRVHDLRHSFVSNCAAKGLSWDQTSLITGHKSYEMYSRYRHFFDKAGIDVVNSFEAPKTYIPSTNNNKQPKKEKN